MGQKITRFRTDYDPGSFTPQGAIALGTKLSAGNLSGSYGAPVVSGVGAVTITGTPAVGSVLVATSPTAAAWTGPGSAQLASIVAASAAIANTETVVVSASLAPNTITAGMSFRIIAAGVGTTGLLPGNDTFRIRIGTTTLTGTIPATVAPAAVASVTAQPFAFEAMITCRTIGAGGTIIGVAWTLSDNVTTGLFALLVDVNTTTATVALDTTATNLLEFTFQSGAATSTATFHIASIQRL